MPHNHNMWATIGVYGGREDNIFWRRLPDDAEGRIEAAGAKSLGRGDFFATERSEWDPESLEERPYDIEKNVKYFEEANRER